MIAVKLVENWWEIQFCLFFLVSSGLRLLWNIPCKTSEKLISGFIRLTSSSCLYAVTPTNERHPWWHADGDAETVVALCYFSPGIANSFPATFHIWAPSRPSSICFVSSTMILCAPLPWDVLKQNKLLLLCVCT